MSANKHTPEPFGFFKADPFGWTDCAETDAGAQPLYEKQAIDDLLLEVEELKRNLDTAGGVNQLLRMRVDELDKQREELSDIMAIRA